MQETPHVSGSSRATETKDGKFPAVQIAGDFAKQLPAMQAAEETDLREMARDSILPERVHDSEVREDDRASTESGEVKDRAISLQEAVSTSPSQVASGMSPPPAPHEEDYDIHDNAIIPDPRKEANYRRKSSEHLMHMHKSRRHQPANDSGFASYASNSVASGTYLQPTTGAQHGRRSSQPPDQNTIVSPAGSFLASECNDPSCNDPTCTSRLDTKHEYTLPVRQPHDQSQAVQSPVGPLQSLPHAQATNLHYPPPYVPSQPIQRPSQDRMGQTNLWPQPWYSTGQDHPPTFSENISAGSRHLGQPTISARRGTLMPGNFPEKALAFGISESSSDSSESEDDADVERRSMKSRERVRSRGIHTRRVLEDERRSMEFRKRERSEPVHTRRVLEDGIRMPLTAENLKNTQSRSLQEVRYSRNGLRFKMTRTAPSRLGVPDSTIRIRRGDAVKDRTMDLSTKDGESITIGPSEESYHGDHVGSRLDRSRNSNQYRGGRQDTTTKERDGYGLADFGIDSVKDEPVPYDLQQQQPGGSSDEAEKICEKGKTETVPKGPDRAPSDSTFPSAPLSDNGCYASIVIPELHVNGLARAPPEHVERTEHMVGHPANNSANSDNHNTFANSRLAEPPRMNPSSTSPQDKWNGILSFGTSNETSKWIPKESRTSRSSSTSSRAPSTLSRSSLKFSDYSVASSLTSLGAITSVAQYSGLVNDITSALFCTKELENILAVAFEDPDIGVERLQTNARRMIQHLGKNLQSEVDDKIQLDTSRALRTQRLSLHAAKLIVQHMERITVKPAKERSRMEPDDITVLDSDDSSSESLDEDDEKDLATTEYREIHDFLVKSRAYNTFKGDLLDFMHRPYERRVSIAIGRNVVGPDGRALNQDAVICIARELSWIPPHVLTFSHDTGLSKSDKLKAFIEDHMGETWNWWPLAPRLHQLRPSYCRLGWRSPCGITRHVDLPHAAKADLLQALCTAPAFLDIDYPISKCPNSSSGSGGTASSTGNNVSLPSQPGLSSTMSASTTSGSSTQSQQISKPAPVMVQSQWSTVKGSRPQQLNHHLSLCIVASSRQFISLKCDNFRSDLQFFAGLKDAYDKARGWPRLWLSMWQYKCSEFVLFHKYGYRRGARVDIGFPSDSDQMYHFLPRKPSPPPPNGPISKEQFQDHYYLDHCPTLYDWKRYQISYRGHFNKVNRTALDAVPKRLVQINMDDGVDEYFYGLYAKEERSFFRVAAYACICNLPGVIFFFLWLFQWGRGSDLQNASVPLSLSLSLTFGFAAVIFGTREN